MKFDLQGDDKAQAYRLLASVVVPRPIAWITTLGSGGEINAAPFSFFNLLGSNPPVVGVNIANRDSTAGTPKDSRANIERTGEFVVSLVTEPLIEAMNICAVDFPAGVSELAEAHLTTLPSVKVSVPRIAESPVNLECRLHSLVPIGDNRIVLAEVVFLHIHDDFIDSERLHVRTEALGLIGRMHGGGWYARTTDLFELPRLSHEEWRKTHE